MKITILTLFPEMFKALTDNSIIKRAIAKNVVEVKIVNFRDYTLDKYQRVDTPPIGGGAGLILKCQPIVDALRKNSSSKSYKILLSPKGKTYNQAKAIELAKKEDIILIAGHYEGVDERIAHYIDEEISLGDYVLTGGEIAAMAIADSIIRLLDGAISKDSLEEESFTTSLLEYPQYTEPQVYEGHKVPDILYTGNHQAIETYRRRESLKLTREKRKDLFDKHELTKQDKKLLKEIDEGIDEPKWLKEALEKGKKFIK